MLAVFLLIQKSMKDISSHKRKALKPAKVEKKSPELLLCRTCLGTEDLVSIFSKDTQKKRSDDLKLVTGLEIKMDDGLSQKICNQCIETMNLALRFRKTSKKAEKSLLAMISGRKSKKKYSTRLKKKVLKKAKIKKPVINDEYVYEPKCEYGDEFQYDDACQMNELKNEEFHDDFQNDDFQSEDYGIKDMSHEDTKVKLKPGRRKKRGSASSSGSYKCHTCNKEFRMKTTYKAHMRFHTNYCICESCGKRCRNNNQLQEHKRARHGLGRIHKCAYCEYSSATKEALTIHERRHTGERPYVCDHCGATFHRRSNLVQHIAIHLPEKNFQCDMCSKRLKSRKFLQIHKHNAHTGRKYGYLCSVCDHRFEKPNKVRAHTRRVHGIPDEQQGPIVRVAL